MAKWTEEEIQYLKDNYADTDNEILAKKLNRSKGAINVKSTYLGLLKNKKIKNEIGMKFGRLTVLNEVEPEIYIYNKPDKTEKLNRRRYLCLCDCGNKKVIQRSSLISGGTTSCGCFKKELSQKWAKTLVDREEYKARMEWDFKEKTCLSALQSKKSVTNTSGFKGVSWDKKRKRWEAYIHFKYKKIHLGLYDDIEDAIKARLKAEEEYFVPVLEKYKDVVK